jgi:hypothetical protein
LTQTEHSALTHFEDDDLVAGWIGRLAARRLNQRHQGPSEGSYPGWSAGKEVISPDGVRCFVTRFR